ncbi:MAG: efflux RND transporter periplasmic adaptor subunit [Pseudomonadota bacterium]|nr:efflux RND transporter periplasmic adaptor subunit [Pseudomonadota bacterium]
MTRVILFIWLVVLAACEQTATPPVATDDHAGHAEHAHHDHQTNMTSAKPVAADYYTCSMHPDIKQSEPGECPICGMNLTLISAEDSLPATAASTDTTDAQTDGMPMLKLKKGQINHFNATLYEVQRQQLHKQIRMLGSVLQSEERESSIPIRVAGRVEKVYIQSTGSFIRTGEAIVDIYSPQLITAGEEYLLVKNNQRLLAQAEKKLKLWGIKAWQYQSWRKNNKVPNHITLYSPLAGIVKKRHARAGRYFQEGAKLFEVYDLSKVWVELDVYEQDINLVKTGQEVSLRFIALPNTEISGAIDFISPFLNSASRTLKIRTTIDNSMGKLKPGMIAEATLQVKLDGEPIVVPRSAVIDTGKRQVVWVKVPHTAPAYRHVYQARVITSGYQTSEYLEITSGLAVGEQVVLEGNFLLDAQAQLFHDYR